MKFDFFINSNYKYYLFDLDNTLYNENIYLFSAYYSIAIYLEEKYHQASVLQYYNFLIMEFLRNGRTNLFQKLFTQYRINKIEISYLLGILRTQHLNPKIKLDAKIYEILKTLLRQKKNLL